MEPFGPEMGLAGLQHVVTCRDVPWPVVTRGHGASPYLCQAGRRGRAPRRARGAWRRAARGPRSMHGTDFVPKAWGCHRGTGAAGGGHMGTGGWHLHVSHVCVCVGGSRVHVVEPGKGTCACVCVCTRVCVCMECPWGGAHTCVCAHAPCVHVSTCMRAQRCLHT